MSIVHTERVLVVPTQLFHRLGHFQGFCADTERYLKPLLESDSLGYRPRKSRSPHLIVHIYSWQRLLQFTDAVFGNSCARQVYCGKIYQHCKML